MIYDLEVINGIKDELVRQRLTLSVAESVTAGHLQAPSRQPPRLQDFSRAV